MIKVTYGPKIDYKHCNGCGRCYQYCPMDVFNWDEKKNRPVIARPEECWPNCVTCELECSELAVNVELPLPAKFFWSIFPEKGK
jgi:adenylylsulfate reductase, subunit B